MLSQPSSSIASRAQRHRRQISTPTAFEGQNLRPIPAIIHHQRKALGHRRGQSLDQQPSFQEVQYPVHTHFAGNATGGPFHSQDDIAVSIGTNPGQYHAQHPMQVAQQHMPAQPGQPGQAMQMQQYQQQAAHHQLFYCPQPGQLQQHMLQQQDQHAPPEHTHQIPSLHPLSIPNFVPSGQQQLSAASQLSFSPSGGVDLSPQGMSPGPTPQQLKSIGDYIQSVCGQMAASVYVNIVPSPPNGPQRVGANNAEEMPLPELGFSDSAPLLSSPLMPQASGPSFSAAHSPSRSSPQAVSVAELSLETSIEDTGVSADEVSAFISAQNAQTHRWTCLFPGCDKTFGRRENIRSHVQTHLGDRQFRCNHCGKCFVRQHDLKRHAKIHSGDKPYRCPCGGGFARQDALTRHRQRGMCVGGFPGVVKAGKTRGRPRKMRAADTGSDKVMRARVAMAENMAFGNNGLSDASMSEEGSPSPAGFANFDSAPLAEIVGARDSDPFSVDEACSSSPLMSTSATNLPGSSYSSPFVIEEQQAQPGSTVDVYDLDSDVDALFNLRDAGPEIGLGLGLVNGLERFTDTQTPPHSPDVGIPGSSSTNATNKSHSRHSGVSNGFTTPPSSPPRPAAGVDIDFALSTSGMGSESTAAPMDAEDLAMFCEVNGYDMGMGMGSASADVPSGGVMHEQSWFDMMM